MSEFQVSKLSRRGLSGEFDGLLLCWKKEKKQGAGRELRGEPSSAVSDAKEW